MVNQQTSVILSDIFSVSFGRCAIGLDNYANLMKKYLVYYCQAHLIRFLTPIIIKPSAHGFSVFLIIMSGLWNAVCLDNMLWFLPMGNFIFVDIMIRPTKMIFTILLDGRPNLTTLQIFIGANSEYCKLLWIFVVIFSLLKTLGEGNNEEILNVFLKTYRCTPHMILENKSPAEVLFARKTRTSWDVIKPCKKTLNLFHAPECREYENLRLEI